MRSIKCVVIGDGAVGKTSLLISYTTNTFPTDYVPTVFDNYTTTISVDPPTTHLIGIYNDTNHFIPSENHLKERKSSSDAINLFKLNLWDTAGQEEYDRLRPLSYPQTDIFLLCFAVNEFTSFKNLNEKWIPELKQHANIENNDMWTKFNKLPILLIGTKSDLRDEDDTKEEDCVKLEDINSFVDKNHLLGYVECSARNQTGITEIFQTAVHKLVYDYDSTYINLQQQQEKKKQTELSQEQPKKDSKAPPTPPPEKEKKPLEKPKSSVSEKKSTNSTKHSTNHSKKSSIHTNLSISPNKRSHHHHSNDKHSSSTSSSNNNTKSSGSASKKNKRKSSCIIM